MERLCDRLEEDIFELVGPTSEIEEDRIRAALRRFKEYEETGLSPEEFDDYCRRFSKIRIALGMMTLEDLETAINSNRVYAFPCAVGDTLYTVKDGRIYKTPVVGFRAHEWKPGFQMLLLFDARLTNGCREVPVSEFGKTVFKTEEEAKTALIKGARK